MSILVFTDEGVISFDAEWMEERDSCLIAVRSDVSGLHEVGGIPLAHVKSWEVRRDTTPLRSEAGAGETP